MTGTAEVPVHIQTCGVVPGTKLFSLPPCFRVSLVCDTLIISSVAESDRGSYLCTAQNDNEDHSDVLRLEYCSK